MIVPQCAVMEMTSRCPIECQPANRRKEEMGFTWFIVLKNHVKDQPRAFYDLFLRLSHIRIPNHILFCESLLNNHLWESLFNI